MQITKTTIRRLTGIAILALAALAFATGAAAGSGGATPLSEKFIPGVTDFPSRLGESGERAAEEFIPGVTDFPSRLGESGERAAEERLPQQSPQAVPIYVELEETGFDWRDAGTGAIAATLLLLGAALSVRMAKRSRVAVG
jgi:hypothetical protein